MPESYVNDVIDDLLLSISNVLNNKIDEYEFIHDREKKRIILKPRDFSPGNTIIIHIVDDKLKVSLIADINRNNNIYVNILGSTNPINDPNIDVIAELLKILQSITTIEEDN